jgi:hypothetical protein
MSALKKSLLAVTAAVALVPTVGFALPPQCDQVCPVTNDCDQECYIGIYTLTTCTDWGWWLCAGAPANPPATSASVEKKAQQSEESSPFCSAEHPEAEQAASETR